MKKYRLKRFLFHLKRFLFHSVAYLLINVAFIYGIKFISYNEDVVRSGDGNMDLFGAIMAICIQLFLGLVSSIVFSTIRKHIHIIFIILAYVLINSLVLLFYIYINSGGLFYSYIYTISKILILGSIIYSYLLYRLN